MPRNWSKAIPEGNGFVPQQKEFGSDQPTLADVYRLFEEIFDTQVNLIKRRFNQFDELVEKTRELTSFSKPRAGCSAATSRHGGRCNKNHQDSQVHGGHRCSRTSDKWG